MSPPGLLPAPATTTRRAHALQRLDASRLRLRATLLHESPPQDASASPAPSLTRLWRRLRRRWRQSPAIDLVLAAAQGWWAAQPWRPVAERAGRELQAVVVPTLRRHPWAAVGLALCAGAAVAAARPWRWPLARTHWHRARRRLWQSTLAFAAQWPLDATLSGLAAAWGARPASTAAAPPPAATADTAPAP